MKRHTRLLMTITAMLMLAVTGCEEDENARLLEMADRHMKSQAEQNKQMTELQREVVKGSRQLVEADARSREEMIALQRDVQAERAEVGHQRDALEEDRRALAASRYLDPIVATAITNTGLILACLLPLVLCWYLLHRNPDDVDAAVNDILIEDFVTENPVLLPPRPARRTIEHRDEPAPSNDADARRIDNTNQ